jgi:hypothetical protein
MTSVLRLRVPLWQRMAYYMCRPLFDLTLWLWSRCDLPIEANPLGWKLVAWYWGVSDRLIPGQHGRLAMRRELLKAWGT